MSSLLFAPVVFARPPCLLPRTSQQRYVLARPFSHSPRIYKKAAKPDKSPAAESADAFDFSALQLGIEQAHVKLREDLSKLRGGGKFNPESIEALKVKIDKGATTERLSNIAQVIPRGRTLQIIASEKEHLKPISSAVFSSNLSLTPQPDSENPLQLNIKLPPPTTEARQQAVQAAQRLADSAVNAVRNARGDQHKALRAMGKAGTARPDDVRKAGDQMEKIVATGIAEVKKIADAVKKVLEGG